MTSEPELLSGEQPSRGAGETRAERKERTRRAILDAGLTLSADSNLSAISLRQVAKQVGVVPTAFYRHFAGIEQLGVALVGESFASLRQVLRERYRPDAIVGRSRSAFEEFMNVVGSVPRDIARLTRDARRGKARIDLDIRRLDSFGDQLDKTLDRVTVGIMTASLVIGSSM